MFVLGWNLGLGLDRSKANRRMKNCNPNQCRYACLKSRTLVFRRLSTTGVFCRDWRPINPRSRIPLDTTRFS
jgi:hypothetical protein